MKKFGLLFIVLVLTTQLIAQQRFAVSGTIRTSEEAISHATISILPGSINTLSNDNGYFRISKLVPGKYLVKISAVGFTEQTDSITISDKNISLDINLAVANTSELTEVIVLSKKEIVSGKLRDVSGTSINAGKKTELINLKYING